MTDVLTDRATGGRLNPEAAGEVARPEQLARAAAASARYRARRKNYQCVAQFAVDDIRLGKMLAAIDWLHEDAFDDLPRAEQRLRLNDALADFVAFWLAQQKLWPLLRRQLKRRPDAAP